MIMKLTRVTLCISEMIFVVFLGVLLILFYATLGGLVLVLLFTFIQVLFNLGNTILEIGFWFGFSLVILLYLSIAIKDTQKYFLERTFIPL